MRRHVLLKMTVTAIECLVLLEQLMVAWWAGLFNIDTAFRVRPCHQNVTADHVTLAYKPDNIAKTLPLGQSFDVSVPALVADERIQVWTCLIENIPLVCSSLHSLRPTLKATLVLQVLAVQLPSAVADEFVGAVPHITISYAKGANAKDAGTSHALH